MTACATLSEWTCAEGGRRGSIFLYNAGGYGTFLQQTGQGEEVEEPSTPSELRKWLQFSPAWRTFDFAYLLLWGGQYLPAINDGQAWRWITAGGFHPPSNTGSVYGRPHDESTYSTQVLNPQYT